MSRNFISLCLVGIVLVSCLPDFSQAQSANIIDIYRKSIFNVAVLKSRKPVVVFYYSSSECNACNWSLVPMLEKMAKRRSESLYLAKVDLDKVPDLKVEHGITTIPTTMVYFQGDVHDLVEGGSWGPIVALVNAAAKLK